MITTFFTTTLAYASNFMASNTVTGTIDKTAQESMPDAASGLIKSSLQKSTTNSEATSVTNSETTNIISDTLVTDPSTAEINSTASDAITSTISSTGAPESLFSWGGYFEAIGLMLLLLTVLWFALHLIRRSGKLKFLPKATTFPRDALTIETQIPLAPKKSLVVVRFLNSHVLLGVTEQNITYLKEVSIHDDEHKYSQENPLGAMDNQQQSANAEAFKRALRDAENNTNTKETLSMF